MQFRYGPTNGVWLPVAGDWNGDRVDTIGLYEPDAPLMHMRNSNTAGVADVVVSVDIVSPFVLKHPGWFRRDASGKIIENLTFGNNEWDWSNPEFRNWWITMIVNDWILKYDLDGFRLDLEPGVTQYRGIWVDVRNRAAQSGKNIVLISESQNDNDNRRHEFHFAQEDFGVNTPFGGPDPMRRGDNIVDSVKSSSRDERFYTYALSSHDRGGSDFQELNYGAQGRPVYFGYGMIFGPLIPFWFMGEEFNNPCTVPPFGSPEPVPCAQASRTTHFDRIYFSPIDWSAKERNISFFNKVKKMIQIRKEYKDIIVPFPLALNQNRIVKITTSGTDLQAYALYNGTTAIVVVGKKAVAAGNVSINIPLSTMGMSGKGRYVVTDLMTDAAEIVNENSLSALVKNISTGDLVVLKVEPAIPGDFNYDGRVNQTDLTEFRANYPPATYSATYDLNHDGTINWSDAGILFSHWTG